MAKLPDGSVVSSFFKTESKMEQDAKNSMTGNANKIVEGQITRIHYVDDASNKSKEYVEYDVVARDSHGNMSTYQNCRNSLDYGGTNNFSEEILEVNEFAFKGKLDKSNFPSNMNGTLVKLAFLENLDKPVIIGGRPHKRSGAASRADGYRKKKVFQGVTEEINKDGEWTRTHAGPNKANGDPTREDTGPVTFKVDKAGDYSVTQKDANSEKWELEAKKITKTAGSVNAEYDGDADKVTFTTEGGAVLTINGAGDITLDFNGTLIKISSGKIELTGAAVDVGEAASALAALGPQLVAWANSHTHGYTDDGSPSQTAPPTVPAPSSVLSTTVKIKP